MGSWAMDPAAGFSTGAASVPKPTVPHYRLDTPLETEKGLPSVTETPPADPPATAPREPSPAPSGSTVLIPDVASQSVEFGAVDLSDSGDDQEGQETGADEQEPSEQGGSVQGSQGASELASPISPRAAPPAKVTAPPSVPVHAASEPPPKAPSVLFKGPLKDLVNLADSASSVPQPVPRP